MNRSQREVFLGHCGFESVPPTPVGGMNKAPGTAQGMKRSSGFGGYPPALSLQLGLLGQDSELRCALVPSSVKRKL